MNEVRSPDGSNIEQADIQPQRSLSWIWLVPLVAALIGAGILYQEYSSRGSTVTLTFSTAEGIESGKTRVKARDVDVGKVSKVTLQKDNRSVLVEIQMNADTDRLLVEDSQFWVVSPRITHNSITGLNTLLSGAYIEMVPGRTTERRYEFDGLEEPPVTPAGTPGLHISLNSDDKFAFSEGDPIIYKGLTVGKFEDIYFDFDERIVYYNVFINAPYHQLVTSNTRFWNASGLDISMTADGINLRTGNVETLLTNGVSFAVPDGLPPGEPVNAHTNFDIYPSRDAAQAVKYSEHTDFIILISDSVRGLTPGAPVEYRGIQIGTVREVNLHNPDGYRMLEQDYQIPVLISLVPGMVGLPDTAEGRHQLEGQIEYWIATGLQASLSTGNFLTGKQVVDLQHYPGEGLFSTEEFMSYPVIPTRSSEFTQITQKVSGLLDKLNDLPLETLTKDARFTLSEVSETMQAYRQTAEQLNHLVNDIQQQKLGEQVASMVNAFEQLASAYSEGSMNHRQIGELIEQLNQSVTDIQPIIRQLRVQPNSLVFPTEFSDEPVPGGMKDE